MRWFFLLLLLANIAYIGWGLSRDPVDGSRVATTVPGAQRVVLLRELKEGLTRPAVTQIEEDREPAEQKPIESPLTTASADKEAAVFEPAAAVPESLAETPVPDDDTLVQHADTQPDEPVGEADRCFTLGPFRELDQLSALTQAINGYVVETGFRSKEEQKPPMFLVYLESAGSMAKARLLASELESKKISDYFILVSGEHKYGISLGIFREKARANRHEQRIRKLGFEPVLEPVFNTYTIYWLDYRIKAGAEIPPKVLKDNLPETVNRLDRPCGP